MTTATTITTPRSLPRRRWIKAVALLAGMMFVLTSCMSADQQKAFDALNNSRTSRGIRAVAENGWLSTFAQDWAEYLARRGSLIHSCEPGTSRCYQTENPYQWRRLAENVGVGSTISSAHAAFMNSAPHRANILNPAFNYGGVGVAYARGKYWVVQEFMQY